MTANNPEFLPWILLAAIPVLIHLLTRRMARRYELPTLRFLKRSIAHQSRLFRLRDLLLLVLRCLLVALVALTFARPAVRSASRGQAAGQQAMAIVLDASLSMNLRTAGTSTFDRARALAQRILRQQDATARAYLVVATSRPRLLNREHRTDPRHLLALLRELRSGQETCDANAAIALAADLLARSGAAVQTLYIISDFQRTNWSGARLDVVPARIRTVFVDASAGETENAAITALTLRPPAPRAGEAAQAIVEVWNGSRTSRTLEVTLVNGSRSQRQQVRVPPYATSEASFPVLVPAPGKYTLRAELPSDNLADDDRRWLVADFRHALTVLLITDEDPSSSEGAALYVRQALSPDPKLAGSTRVLLRRPTQNLEPTLRSADAVVLCVAADMPEGRMREIAAYLREGGSGVVFLHGPGARQQIRALDEIGGPDEKLPFLPERRIVLRDKGTGGTGFGEARLESAILRLFRDRSQGDLAAPRFHAYYLTSEPDSRAEVLLRFEDGTPAAAWRSYGRGALMLCNFSPSPLDSDLRTQPVFVPLIHELIKGLLAGEAGERGKVPGNVALLALQNVPSDIVAIGPDGAQRSAVVDTAARSVLLEGLDKVGEYQILGGGRVLGRIAVNADPAESDLRAIDPRELRGRQPTKDLLLHASTNASQVTGLGEDIPLWHWLALASLLVLTAESLVSVQRLRRSAASLGGDK